MAEEQKEWPEWPRSKQIEEQTEWPAWPRSKQNMKRRNCGNSFDESYKKEAIRATSIAENKMLDKDFTGARKFALKAQLLFPDLENVSQMLAVCEVHCSAEAKVNGETDWYKILQVAPTSDKLTIKKQYLKLYRLLHNNKFGGAEAAFALVGEAYRMLTDQSKRRLYDMQFFKVDGESSTANDGKYEKVKLPEVNRKEEAMKDSVRNRGQKRGREFVVESSESESSNTDVVIGNGYTSGENVGIAGSSPQRSTTQMHDTSYNEVTSDEVDELGFSNEVTGDESSTDASLPFNIKSKLPWQLRDLSVQKIQDIVAEADAAGQAHLSDQLIPMYTLAEELRSSRYSSRRGDSMIAFCGLREAQDAAMHFWTEQEEIDKSLTAAEFKVAELESALARAKDEVLELGRRRSALVPMDPHIIQKHRREVLKQQTLERISMGKIEFMEAEYKKLLLDLE